MRIPFDFQKLRGRPLFPIFFLGILAVVVSGSADENGRPLPFDPAKISRLSVDQIPRSLSIRQGADVWLGYDLEKAVLFKAWQAPKGKNGVILKGFKAVSAGTAWFEAKTGPGWQLRAEEKTMPLTVRYLGCTEDKGHFELRWELSHPKGTIQMSERIPVAPATSPVRVYREMRAESLKAGESLVLPSAYRGAWVLTGPESKSVSSLTGPAWHRLSLP